jgi:hypothetical protein
LPLQVRRLAVPQRRRAGIKVPSGSTTSPPCFPSLARARSRRGARAAGSPVTSPGPAADRGRGDAVAAGHASQPVVVAQRGQHDQGDLAGRQLAPPGAGLVQAGAQQPGGEGERLVRQRQGARAGKRGAPGGLGSGCIHTRLQARRGIPAGRTLAAGGSGRDGERAGRGAAQPAAVPGPLELGADVLALQTGHVQAGPLSGHHADHRPAGPRRDRRGQRPAVTGEAPGPAAWLRSGTSSPEPRCAGPAAGPPAMGTGTSSSSSGDISTPRGCLRGQS